MITFRGALLDGVHPLGDTAEQQITKAYQTSLLSNAITVYRIDESTGGTNTIPSTTEAVNVTANAFSPFGPNFIPAAAMLNVFDSIDGIYASNPLTLSEGSITSLQSTGEKWFTFPANTNRKTWKPPASPSANVPALKYIRFEVFVTGSPNDSFVVAKTDGTDITAIGFKVDTAGSVSVAVKTSGMTAIMAAGNEKYTDVTSEFTGTLVQYVPAAATRRLMPGEKFLIGTSEIATELERYLFQEEGGSSLTYKVSQSTSSGFVELTDFVSGNNFDQTGPVTSQATAVNTGDSWTTPTSAGKRSLGTLPLAAGGTEVSPNLSWLMFEVTASDKLTHQSPIGRSRAVLRGNGNPGLILAQAESFTKAVIYAVGPVTGTGNRTIVIRNPVTGASKSVVISGLTQSNSVLIDLGSAITFAAGDKIQVHGSTGGISTSDALIRLT